MVLGLSIFFSFSGVFFAAIWLKDASHAGRGGALAVAISFFSLFATRNYGARIYGTIVNDFGEVFDRIRDMKGAPDGSIEATATKIDKLERKIDGLQQRIEVDLAGQRRENVFIAISGGLGTIFWGFGDYMAEFFL